MLELLVGEWEGDWAGAGAGGAGGGLYETERFSGSDRGIWQWELAKRGAGRGQNGRGTWALNELTEKRTKNRNRNEKLRNRNRYKILLYGHINRIDLAISSWGGGERERARYIDNLLMRSRKAGQQMHNG